MAKLYSLNQDEQPKYMTSADHRRGLYIYLMYYIKVISYASVFIKVLFRDFVLRIIGVGKYEVVLTRLNFNIVYERIF